MAPGEGLTAEQIAIFERDGYLIVPDALPREIVSRLLQETNSLLNGFSLEDHPMTKFSTGEGSEHVGDDYFLSSGDKIRFFFEEDAFDPAGNLTKSKAKAINKIGHYLHVLSPPFASLISPASQRHHSPSAIARSLSFRQPQCLQSMIICKQPEIGGAVPPHQDSTFLYTNPPSAVGFWYALEDATRENGCLSFLKGSHRWTPIRQRFVRKASAGSSGGGTEFVDNVGGKAFPNDADYQEQKGEMGGDSGRQERLRGGEYELGEVKAGSLVLIHGNLLHKSEKNTSSKGRIIYTFHVIEGQDAVYDERNWLQPPKEGFTNL